MTALKNLLNNFWTNPKKWQNSASFLLVVGFFVFMAWFFSSRRDGQYFKKLTRPESETASASNSFENAKLEARAAYVFDILENRAVFELNSEAQLPLASITKIMTAIVAKENLPPFLLVTISKEAVLEEGDEGFIVDEQWPVSDLIDAMLVSSSNDAAAALASEYYKDFNGDFVFLMNKKAEEIGLTQTYFLNSTGLDLSENASGAYGSAKDVAKMFLYAVQNHSSSMEITRLTETEINSRKFKNTNQVINELPGFMAGKTGYSVLAGGNLVVAVDRGYQHPFIIVILGSTYDGRFSDVKTLYNLIP